MVKVIWTDFAIEDLRSIHEFISKDSNRYADRYVEKLISRVDQLENFPKSGRGARIQLSFNPRIN